jgi:acetyltransferase-like isoleucine patch superfamily enzyme
MQNRHETQLERKSLYLFNLYSYAYNVLFVVLDLLPQFLRRVAFGAMFRKLGSGGLIDYRTHFRYPSKMSIGSNVFINHSCAFYGSSLPGVEIVVGDNVALGPHVKIFTASHDYSTWDLRDVAKSVMIGANSWIGGGSIILPGVTVGEGAVVGAGSVVSRDIEPFTIAVGNPARAVKRRSMGNERSD